MARKGTQVINSSTMAILAILVAATMAALAINIGDLHKVTLEEDITKIVSNRVSSGVYGVDSYSRGSLEMDLGTTYRVSSADNGNAVNVSLASSTDISSAVYQLLDRGSQSSSYSISNFYVDSNVVFPEEITARRLCVEKQGNKITVTGGEC